MTRFGFVAVWILRDTGWNIILINPSIDRFNRYCIDIPKGLILVHFPDSADCSKYACKAVFNANRDSSAWLTAA
jgi:hypothetical protein